MCYNITIMTNDELNNKRHTLAHILAKVSIDKYPNTLLTLGPAIDNGFYYDMDFVENKISQDDLTDLTKRMMDLIKIGGTFSHREISPDEGKEYFKNNKYKLELINEIIDRGEKITLYTINFNNGETFTDLCRGGHCENISDMDVESFQLNKIAGSYWRGDEKREQLTRIYGLAFNTKEELENYKVQLEEAKKRDHRILGKELGLFIFSDLVGPGLPLWTPRGTILRRQIDNFVQELRSEYNYMPVTIPHITKSDLYKKSQHWEKYAEDLFKIETRDGHIFCMKPMNCPHHSQIYNSELRSYKELPIRYSETTMVYRDEQSGELSGLSRVLSITQDDAHIFCRENQLNEEINAVWDLIEKFYKTFDFVELTARFSRRNDDTKYKGNPELWEKAESIIKNLLEIRAGGKWIDGEGEAAFYGPKIDFLAKDAIGRSHQVATIQLDFVQPENLELEYVNEKGLRERPVMIHCAIAGSLERFVSVYIEHCAGNFPLWLAPTQIMIVPIKSEEHISSANNLAKILKENNIRYEIANVENGFGKNIRKAKDMKIPYTIIIGDKDLSVNKYTLESRDNGQVGQMNIEELIVLLNGEIKERK